MFNVRKMLGYLAPLVRPIAVRRPTAVLGDVYRSPPMPQCMLVSFLALYGLAYTTGFTNTGRGLYFFQLQRWCCISNGVASIVNIAAAYRSESCYAFVFNVRLERYLKCIPLSDNFAITILFFSCKTSLGCFRGTKLELFSFAIFMYSSVAFKNISSPYKQCLPKTLKYYSISSCPRIN